MSGEFRLFFRPVVAVGRGAGGSRRWPEVSNVPCEERWEAVVVACKPQGFRAITRDALQEKDTQQMEPEKKLAGDKRRQTAVIILCWTVGRSQSSSIGHGGVFLRGRVGERQRQQTPADEGFGGKGKTGFGCLRRASQSSAGSVRLRQGLCFGYAPVAWMGRWISLPLDADCRLPMVERIGRGRKKDSQGGWEQGLQWKTERARRKLAVRSSRGLWLLLLCLGGLTSWPMRRAMNGLFFGAETRSTEYPTKRMKQKQKQKQKRKTMKRLKDKSTLRKDDGGGSRLEVAKQEEGKREEGEKKRKETPGIDTSRGSRMGLPGKSELALSLLQLLPVGDGDDGGSKCRQAPPKLQTHCEGRNGEPEGRLPVKAARSGGGCAHGYVDATMAAAADARLERYKESTESARLDLLHLSAKHRRCRAQWLLLLRAAACNTEGT